MIEAHGTRNSNQVRELVLGEAGVQLADVYTAAGEVLMGTARWEEERADREAAALADAEQLARRRELAATEAALRRQRESCTAELELLDKAHTARERAEDERRGEMTARRGAEWEPPKGLAS